MHTTTPAMPAELAEIIATHRALFGGFTMLADGEGADTPPPAYEGGSGDDSADGEGDSGEGQTFDAAYVARLRREAADYRTKAKANADAAKRLAELEEANKSEADKIADRATKAEEERDRLASELAAVRRDQAIYRNAGTADPAALLDSRAFLESIADLDPSDDKAVKAAIAAAVKEHPRLARNGRTGGDLAEGQRRQADPNSTQPGVHRMAAAFEAQMGNTP